MLFETTSEVGNERVAAAAFTLVPCPSLQGTECIGQQMCSVPTLFPVFDSNRRLEMTGPTTDQTQDIIDRHAQKKRAEIHEIVQVELAKWRAAGSPELNPNADMPQGVWDKETEVAVKSAIIAEQLQNQQAAIDAEQAIRQEQM